MDRMRDRLDKIARQSRSASAGQSDPKTPMPSTSGRPFPPRQTTPRQGKPPIPRSPESLPARTRAASSLPSPRGRGVGGEVPLRAPSPPSAPSSLTAPSARSGDARRTPLHAVTERGSEREAAQRTPPAADVARTPGEPQPQPQPDALPADRILELPARVTAARKQRQLAVQADTAADTAPPHPSQPCEPARLPPMSLRATAQRPARPVRPDVTAPEPPPPIPLPLHTTPASNTRSTATKPAPARGDPRPVRPSPASARQRTADARTGDDNALPENVEPLGGAMQRFLTVLAERRRQRALGGGDGGEPPRPSEPEERCPVCGGAGYVRLDVPVSDPRFGQPVPCKCKEREFEKRRRMEEERRVLELDRFFSLKPFGDKTFESYNPRVAGVKEAYDAAHTFAEDPTGAPFRWLVLMGGTGVGKTHLAAAIAHERLEARSSVFFAVVPDLLDHLRAAFAPSAEMPYNEMFETVREVEMLILDDLGSENSTAWATEKLFQIINYRYNYRMPTVITTNSRLFEHMDERIASRLADSSLARTVVIEAQSRRQGPGRQSPGRNAPPRW